MARIASLIALALLLGTALGCGRMSLDMFRRPEAVPAENLHGTWVAWHDKKTEILDLRADGTFRFVLVGDGVADFSGKWAVKGKELELSVEKFVDGNRDRIGDRVRWGVEKAEVNELVLAGIDTTTTYTRKAEVK